MVGWDMKETAGMEVACSIRGYLSLQHQSTGKRMFLFALLGIQVVLALALGLPGHLSVDSIVQLYEGKTLEFISFNPPLMSLLLGFFDQIGPAPALFVVLSTLMLGLSTWLVIAAGERNVSTFKLILVAILILNPIPLIYSGIVWKDVLLAHCVILAFLLTELISRTPGKGRYFLVFTIWALLIFIVGIRQQGILFALPLAVWVSQRLCPQPLRVAGASLLFFGSAMFVNKAITDFSLERKVGGDPPGLEVGVKTLMRYDMVGMLAYGASPPQDMDQKVYDEMLPEVEKYSSYRVDTLDGPSALYWSQSMERTRADWLGHVIDYPFSYIRHRVMVALRLLGIGDMWQCLPYYRGVVDKVVVDKVDGELTDLLGIEASSGRWSQGVFDMVQDLEYTPFYRHWFYLLLAVALMVYFYRQGNWLLLTLVACTGAYIGSYSVIGIACDFRYGYPLTVVVTLLTARALLAGCRPGAQHP
jgi:hypothetical protein